MTKLSPDAITTHVPEPALTLEQALDRFLRMLQGRNLSNNTFIAYRADLAQFISWVGATDVSITRAIKSPGLRSPTTWPICQGLVSPALPGLASSPPSRALSLPCR